MVETKLTSEEMYEELMPEQKAAVDATIDSMLIRQNSDCAEKDRPIVTLHDLPPEERKVVLLYRQLNQPGKTAAFAILYSEQSCDCSEQRCLSEFCYQHTLGQCIDAISLLQEMTAVSGDHNECRLSAIKFIRKAIDIKLEGYRVSSYSARCRHGCKSRRLTSCSRASLSNFACC